VLTTAMGAASDFYISHSTPSPHANPAASTSRTTGPGQHVDLPPPSRTLLLLQSPTTRRNLTRIHATSGQAVKLSGKTVGMIDNVISRVTGSNKGKGRATPASNYLPASSNSSTLQPSASNSKPQLPPRSRPSSPAPPPYTPRDEKAGLASRDEKPGLPPRRSLLPSPSLPSTPLPAETKPKAPSSKARIALSAALVFSALASSSQRLVDAGGNAISAAVTHKYGAAAGENARLATGTARNVVLVYVDVRGMGRRAIVKRAAKGMMKGMVMKGAKPGADQR
jgi:spartin